MAKTSADTKKFKKNKISKKVRKKKSCTKENNQQ